MTDSPITLTIMTPITRARETDSNSPAFVTDECEAMYRRSQLCRDLRGGHVSMMARAETYLPQYEGEHEEDYKERLKFASLRNFYAQAVSTIIGKMFAQPPKLNTDVPKPILNDLKDADLNGNDWTVVAEEFVNYALDEGVSWILVDYHTVPDAGSLTLEDEMKMGVRPYWVVIPQHQVLGVRYTQYNGVYIITQFRYSYSVMEADGEFGEKCVDKIRVVETNRYRTYTKDDKTGDWVQDGLDMPNTLGMVPAVALCLDKKGTFLSAPPLENLAYMNLEHFQIRTDQRRSLSVASYPILAQYGVDAKAGVARIGPMTSIAFEDPNARMTWVESQGVHLMAGDRELVRLESQMRTFGLSFENPGMYATATGRNIDASDSIAPIQRWAFRLRDVMNSVLWYMAKWRKLSEGGTVNVNTSFLKNFITVEELKLLVETLKEGAITKESFLSRMQDYGLLSNEMDINKEVDDLAAAAERVLKEQQDLLKVAPKPGTPTPPPNNADPAPDNLDQ